MAAQRISIEIGQRFGRFTVSGEAGYRNKNRMFDCVCDCGAKRTLAVTALHKNLAVSCGCWRKDRLTVHGRAKSSIYRIWSAMKSRCSNPQAHAYHRYGGRGIRVCKRWANSFAHFLADMGERPSGTSLDRIDNDGNYSPSNCRWATRVQQMNNRGEFNVKLTLHGCTQTLAAWSREFGIRGHTIQRRLRRGWTAEKALALPAKTHKLLRFRGRSQSIRAWGRELNVPYRTIAQRLERGWSIAEALEER